MSIAINEAMETSIDGRPVYETLRAITKKFCKKYHCGQSFEDFLSYAWTAWARFHSRWDTSRGVKYWSYVGKCVFLSLCNVWRIKKNQETRAIRNGVKLVGINPDVPLHGKGQSEEDLRLAIEDWIGTLSGHKKYIIRHILLGESALQISKDLGLAENTVKVIRNEAQRDLRQWMIETY